jgi:hypothetical protein
MLFVWISLEYVRLVCGREILTADHFPRLIVGYFAPTNLTCRVRKATFIEAIAQNTFSSLLTFLLAKSFFLGPVPYTCLLLKE